MVSIGKNKVIIRSRSCGKTHEMVFQIKKTLNERGECGVGMLKDPTNILKRLNKLGMTAIAEPIYRIMPPMIKKNEFGDPIDLIVGEKVKTGYVFYYDKTD